MSLPCGSRFKCLFEDAPGQAPRTETIGTIERHAERAPVSGSDLFVGETHEILGKAAGRGAAREDGAVHRPGGSLRALQAAAQDEGL